MYLLKAKYVFPLIFLLSFLVFLAHTAITKTAIFADGKFYFAGTRSIVIDHDIYFANEFDSLNIQKGLNFNLIRANPYPPGTSIFWIPLFEKAHAFVKILNLIPGIYINSDGYNIFYQSAIALTSIFLGTFALYLCYILLRGFFKEKTSLLTIVTLWGATNILFYTGVEPINSHATSFFISSLFIFYFLKMDTNKEKDYYMALGFLGGIAGLVRTQDSLLLILPVWKILIDKNFKLLTRFIYYMQLVIGFLVGFLPQIILWKYFYNTFWLSPYFGTGFNLLKPQIIDVLFNTQNGLFTITPVIAIAILGLFYLRKTNPHIFFISFSYFLLQLYLVSSWKSTQGGSFGIRMLITTYPLLFFGLAAVIERVLKKFGENSTLLLISIFSFLNCGLIINYLLKY